MSGHKIAEDMRKGNAARQSVDDSFDLTFAGDHTFSGDVTFSGATTLSGEVSSTAAIATTGVVTGSSGIVTQYSDDDVTATPTAAEITAAFGAPATVGAGFIGILDDAGGGTAVYTCFTDGTSWFYVAGTKAL